MTTAMMNGGHPPLHQPQTQFGGGGGGKVPGFTVLPPKAMGAADPQPPVAATNDNLRRNLWANVRLFAEEVAEAAAEGKENGLEPEEWTKINDTVNSIQLCLFLLREPYLSPTQVWLGHNQCKTTDRVSFKLSAIGREYEHDHRQQQNYPDDCAGSPPSATDKLRRRRNAKRAAPEAAASTKHGARGKSTKRARSASKKSAAAPMTATPPSSASSSSARASSSRKRCGEMAHTVVQEADSEEELLSCRTPPPAPTGSSSSSWLSEAFNSVGLYDRHLRQTLSQPPLPPPYHAHHDLQQLAPSMVAAFPLQPTTTTTTCTTTMAGSGLASLLACAEAETEEAEAGGNDVGRRPNPAQARGGGNRRTVATASPSPSSGARSPSDIYRLLN